MVPKALSTQLKRWTVDDYHRMIATGILTRSDRVELLEGQIVEMVPQDPPHASRIDDGGDYLKALFVNRAKVRVQLPITIAPGSEPEPDFAIVRFDEHRYRNRHPNPNDVFCVIEVAATTWRRDYTYKTGIYAQAGICEYWILDLNRQQVTVLKHPDGKTYSSEQVFTAADQIAVEAFPDIVIALHNLLA